LERVRHLLFGEIRLDREQAHLAEAAQFYAETPDVVIPRVLPFCTRRITAMERVEGCKVTEARLAPAAARRLAIRIGESLVARPLWHHGAVTLFHADPHAGNLLFIPHEQLGILDWSLAGHLSKSDQEQLMQVLLAALTLNGSGLGRALGSLSRAPARESALTPVVSDALRQIRGGAFPGFGWLLQLLDTAVAAAAVDLSGDLVFFRKALLSVTGVLEDVCEGCTLDSLLLDAGARAFSRELPGRILAPAHSRAFGMHVSNADLLSVWAAWPLTTMQYWSGVWQDFLTRVTEAKNKAFSAPPTSGGGCNVSRVARRA
jgi:ubiquinone biosynthesis protein